MHLFAYGTLMFAKIWTRIVGREYRKQRAKVAGFTAYKARGEVFPVMVRSEPEKTVDGVVYFDVDYEDVALLDEFESDLYERVQVDAALEDGTSARCEAYLLPQRHRHLASPEWWDADWFEREAAADYLRRLK